MKKLLVYFAIFIAFIAIWAGESRRFFCLNSGRCVTVWKTYNNICYIIPGKYYGILRPSDEFIETTNNNFLTVYFSSDLLNSLVYRSEQTVTIKNADKTKWVFYDYNSNIQRFHSLLYIPNAKRHNDIKENTELIEILVGEYYALDAKGKLL